NETVFTTVTVIDVNEEGKPVIYMECFLGIYSQLENTEKGRRTVIVGRGNTITEAIQRINQTASREVSVVYSKMIVFTKKASEKGVGDFLDILVRDQESLLRPYVVIFDGDPMELLNVKLAQTDYVGLYLEKQFQSNAISNMIKPYNLAEYMNLRSTKAQLAVIAIIGVDENEADPYLGIKEAAVVEDDKMIETLTEDEYKSYCLLSGFSKATLLTVDNPQDKESKITLNVLNNKTKKSIKYDGKSGNLIHYKVELNLAVSFEETQKPLALKDDSIRKKIVKEIQEKIEGEGSALFEKYKVMGIDLFDVEDELYRNYPKYQMSDVVGSTDIEIVVKVHLEGSPDTQNYN
ncbi:MAG: Ger(x)C family spore germination protein, partial [Vallitaleaceae bacterium]|nr:Ger(x)C family spore germination protein [Vallitaleaceae bacterium]